jgi:hypothetical protein
MLDKAHCSLLSSKNAMTARNSTAIVTDKNKIAMLMPICDLEQQMCCDNTKITLLSYSSSLIITQNDERLLLYVAGISHGGLFLGSYLVDISWGGIDRYVL